MKPTTGQWIVTIFTLAVGIAATVGYFRAHALYTEFKMCRSNVAASARVSALQKEITLPKNKRSR